MKKKTLSTGKKLLVMLFFSISVIFLGIILGFFIKFLYISATTSDEDAFGEAIIALVFCFILGAVFSITLMILLRDYNRNKKEKNVKWYIDKFLLSLTPVFITVTTVLFSFGYEDNENIYLLFSIVGFLIIGISTTPNVILYALNDMKNWKNIFYNNGNLPNHKKVSGFFRMQAPVSFEKKLYFAVLKDQVLNFSTVVLFITGFLIVALFSCSHKITGTSGNLIYAIVHTRALRAEGYLFFGSVFLASFWIPILAYYITNAAYKLKVVKRHEYIVYHAIVDKVDTFKIRINNSSGVHYAYDYCSCVGIKSKDINKTEAILIFVPDDLFLFPDNK